MHDEEPHLEADRHRASDACSVEAECSGKVVFGLSGGGVMKLKSVKGKKIRADGSGEHEFGSYSRRRIYEPP